MLSGTTLDHADLVDLCRCNRACSMDKWVQAHAAPQRRPQLVPNQVVRCDTVPGIGLCDAAGCGDCDAALCIQMADAVAATEKTDIPCKDSLRCSESTRKCSI